MDSALELEDPPGEPLAAEPGWTLLECGLHEARLVDPMDPRRRCARCEAAAVDLRRELHAPNEGRRTKPTHVVLPPAIPEKSRITSAVDRPREVPRITKDSSSKGPGSDLPIPSVRPHSSVSKKKGDSPETGRKAPPSSPLVRERDLVGYQPVPRPRESATPETRARAIDLVASGVTPTAAARALGVKRSLLHEWMHAAACATARAKRSRTWKSLVSPSERAEALACLARGEPIRSVAERYGFARQHLRKWKRDATSPQLARALQLLDEGEFVSDIAAALGIGPRRLYAMLETARPGTPLPRLREQLLARERNRRAQAAARLVHADAGPS